MRPRFETRDYTPLPADECLRLRLHAARNPCGLGHGDCPAPVSRHPPAEGGGRMSSTVSEGRHSRTPRGVITMGRLIRIGWASI